MSQTKIVVSKPTKALKPKEIVEQFIARSYTLDLTKVEDRDILANILWYFVMTFLKPLAEHDADIDVNM